MSSIKQVLKMLKLWKHT